MHDTHLRALSSSVSTLVSYPLETYKVHRVMNTTLVAGRLYSGVEVPLIMNSVVDCLRLTIFEGMSSHGVVVAAAFAGVANAVLTIPLDSYKLSRQTGRSMTLRGWQGILLKEVIGSTVYLGGLSCVQQMDPTVVETVVWGGLTGVLATTSVYPLDSLRIRYQTGTRTIQETLRQESRGSLWRGYKFSVYKAFVQSAVMVTLITMM